MKLTLEEIIKRCEVMYKLSQRAEIKLIKIGYKDSTIGFLDVCLIFNDIGINEYKTIQLYYKNKFEGNKIEEYLLGYDLTKIKVELQYDKDTKVKI